MYARACYGWRVLRQKQARGVAGCCAAGCAYMRVFEMWGSTRRFSASGHNIEFLPDVAYEESFFLLN